MNKVETLQKLKDANINLSAWCRSHGFAYPQVVMMLKNPGRIMETKKQRVVIDALIADGFYVPSDEEKKAA